MNVKHIAVIYFYAISAASLALIVVGIFSSVNFIINITQYDKYPLRYQNDDCSMYPNRFSKPVPVSVNGIVPTPTQQELDQGTKQCEKQLDNQRKQEKLDDLKGALTFSFVGLILFFIHFPQALKKSKEAK